MNKMMETCESIQEKDDSPTIRDDWDSFFNLSSSCFMDFNPRDELSSQLARAEQVPKWNSWVKNNIAKVY